MSFAAEIGESEYVSQYATPTLGFVIHKAGVPADADANDVTVKMTTLDEATILFDRAATRLDVGTYEITLSSAETSDPGMYRLVWSYDLDAVPQSYTGLVEVGLASPAYDRLDDSMKALVESAWIRFADLFDSPDGGPHLQVYFQSRFGRGRMAQLLQVALGHLNTMAQPYMTYSLEGPPAGKQFPLAQWGALLENALYIEAIKHLIRSYTEQPESIGVNVARLDRRDYINRWTAILNMERPGFESQMDVFKMAHMGLGRPRVLVSGGVYGSYGPTRLAGSAAARPRYYQRFH